MRYLPLRLAMVLTVMLPAAAHAIHLQWSSGSTSLTFSGAVRCTLSATTETGESSLPGEWRLMWVGTGCNLDTAVVSTSGGSGSAAVCSLSAPTTAAQVAANQATAEFCSSGGPVTSASYVLDLPAGAHGRIKAVALDPSDSTQITSSNEVRYNGGVSGRYPPVVLRASSIHRSLQLRVIELGADLGSATSMTIMAPDTSWSLPLTIRLQSENSLTGTATTAALLPGSEATLGSSIGAASDAFVPADTDPSPEDPSNTCGTSYTEDLLNPPPTLHGYTIQPKDFAFARGFVDTTDDHFALHLFYIRHNYWYDDTTATGPFPDLNEKNIGHIWTSDFDGWYGPAGENEPDTVALAVRSNNFDALHVWAPTIVQRGPVFWMFYTGVSSDFPDGPQHQRIGVATSTDLITWTPDTLVLTCPMIHWAKRDPSGFPYFHAQQLRDPFVMEDPVHPGQWLMYFVAVDSSLAPRMAVGVARSADLRTWVPDEHPLRGTQDSTSAGLPDRVESPHVFRRNGQWWMPYTVNGDQIFFETTDGDPTDTLASSWTGPIWMRGITLHQPTEMRYWHASEYLRVNTAQYLAAYNDNATSIDIKGFFSTTDSAGVDSFMLSCPAFAGAPDPRAPFRDVHLGVLHRWGAPDVELRVDLPARMRVRLAVYDIAGRRRSVVLDRELAGGTTSVTWDGRDLGGRRVSPGMYFIRLTYAHGAQASKVVMLR